MSEKYLIYLRKSRSDGVHETVEDILAKHFRMLQDYAELKLGTSVTEEMIYREVVSGETIQDRPEMKKLLDRIRNEDIKGVLVVEPQRLSRGDLSDCGTVIRAFRYTDTLILTPQKTYDLNDKFERKFFEMELLRGNDYLEYVKEIMLRGRLASVREGNYIGSVAPYGYDKVKEGSSFTLVPNSEADVVRLIFELWTNENIGAAAIASRLNDMHIKPRRSDKWSIASIRDMLRNPVYIGKIRWNHRKTVKKYEGGELKSTRPNSPREELILTDGRHEPLISDETFKASMCRFGNVPKVKAASEIRNPFAGIVHCVCGRAMIYQSSRKCAPRLHCAGQGCCGNRSVRYREVESEVLQALRIFAEKAGSSISDFQEEDTGVHKAVTASLIKELDAVEVQQTRLYGFLEQGVYTAEVFEKRNAALARRRRELQEAIAEAKSHERVETKNTEKCITFNDALALFDDEAVSAEAKNILLRAVIKDIVYSRDSDDKSGRFSLDITLL